VFLAMPLACVPVAAGIFWLVEYEPRHGRLAQLDLAGAILASTGALLVVYGLVQAPQHGWRSPHTVVALPTAVVLLVVFVLHERRTKTPLLELSIFQIRGLGAADVTTLVGFAGFIAPFFFVTLYMQEVLGYSPLKSGLGFVPMAVGVVISARISARIVGQLGARALLVAGGVSAAGGIAALSRMPIHASYLADVLPGLAIMAVGLGALSVGATIAGTAHVPPHQAGLAAALLNTSQQIGGALGLAIFSAIATSRTNLLLATGASTPAALTSGFRQALVAASIFLLAAAAIATRTARRDLVDPSVLVDGTKDARRLEPAAPAPAIP
jgi:predicted MFS family arabinose efflux permease